MVLNTVVFAAYEAIRVVVRDLINGGAAADRFLARLAAQVDLYVHHVMLDNCLGVVHLGTVEDYIAGPHFFLLEFNGHGIKLIALIAWSQLETKFFSKIVNDSSDQPAAV